MTIERKKEKLVKYFFKNNFFNFGHTKLQEISLDS